MPENGLWTDFITDFMQYTESAFTTEIHRKWTAISLVAAALERRVWAKAGDRLAYPNLYVLLVAPPGVGKYIIEEARSLWLAVEGKDGPLLHIAPDSVSRASLVDEINNSRSTHLSDPLHPLIYHSLIVASEEFEVILPAYESSFISLLNRIWNNPPFHRETRRHGPAKDIRITSPQLNILAGAQPSYFTAHFPEEAWSTGLIRRIIMVYSAEAPLKDIFSETPNRQALRLQLIQRLTCMAGMYGQAQWERNAVTHLSKWHMDRRPPVPAHSKLQYYESSRTLFVIKLALVSAISRSGEAIITETDIHRAQAWLFEAEKLMPDIFREMAGKSDAQVIEEMHYFIQALYVKNNRKPVRTASIVNFLSQRLPSEKVEKVFQVAERSNVVARVAGTEDLWLPRPRHLHGVE